MAGPAIDPKKAAEMQRGATQPGPGGQAIMNAGKSLWNLVTGQSAEEAPSDACPHCGQPAPKPSPEAL